MARKLYLSLSLSLAEPHGSLPLSSSPRSSHTPVARLFRLQCWGRAPSLSRFLFAPRAPSEPTLFRTVRCERTLSPSVPRFRLYFPPAPSFHPIFLSLSLARPLAPFSNLSPFYRPSKFPYLATHPDASRIPLHCEVYSQLRSRGALCRCLVLPRLARAISDFFVMQRANFSLIFLARLAHD